MRRRRYDGSLHLLRRLPDGSGHESSGTHKGWHWQKNEARLVYGHICRFPGRSIHYFGRHVVGKRTAPRDSGNTDARWMLRGSSRLCALVPPPAQLPLTNAPPPPLYLPPPSSPLSNNSPYLLSSLHRLLSLRSSRLACYEPPCGCRESFLSPLPSSAWGLGSCLASFRHTIHHGYRYAARHPRYPDHDQGRDSGCLEEV